MASVWCVAALHHKGGADEWRQTRPVQPQGLPTGSLRRRPANPRPGRLPSALPCRPPSKWQAGKDASSSLVLLLNFSASGVRSVGTAHPLPGHTRAPGRPLKVLSGGSGLLGSPVCMMLLPGALSSAGPSSVRKRRTPLRLDRQGCRASYRGLWLLCRNKRLS